MVERVLVSGGNVIDGTGAAPAVMDVLVAGGKIEAVAPDLRDRQPDCAVVDASGKTVMPGLIDIHTHFVYDRYFRGLTDLSLTASPEMSVIIATQNARLFLETGVTTAQEVGCKGNTSVAIRDAIERGLIVGPRVRASAQIISYTGGLDSQFPSHVTPAPNNRLGVPADGVAEVVKEVRRQVSEGVDNVKIAVSGSANSGNSDPWTSGWSFDEVDAIMREAARSGKTVAAHAHAPQGIKDCLRAGVTTIHHGNMMDDECIAMWKDSPSYFAPTALKIPAFIEMGPEVGWPQKSIEHFKKVYDYAYKMLRKFVDAGLSERIVCGGDTGNVPPHGNTALELQRFTEIGLSPMEAIVAATRRSAEALYLGDEIGTIEPGKSADLLVVEQDPLRDIRVLQDHDGILLVMKEGTVYRDRLERPPATREAAAGPAR